MKRKAPLIIDGIEIPPAWMCEAIARQKREIKVGDRVKCIDTSASFHRLTEGGIYTVEAAYNGEPVVVVNQAYHSIDRFELAEWAT